MSFAYNISIRLYSWSTVLDCLCLKSQFMGNSDTGLNCNTKIMNIYPWCTSWGRKLLYQSSCTILSYSISLSIILGPLSTYPYLCLSLSLSLSLLSLSGISFSLSLSLSLSTCLYNYYRCSDSYLGKSVKIPSRYISCLFYI